MNVRKTGSFFDRALRSSFYNRDHYSCGGFQAGTKRVGLFFLLSLFLCSCAGPFKPGPDSYHPADSAYAESIFRAVEEGQVRVKSLRASGALKLISSRENIRARSLVLVRRPGLWRMEILNPMNMPVFTLGGDGDGWFGYSFAENRYARGKGAGDAVLPGIQADHLSFFLSGRLPLMTCDPEAVQVSRDGELSLLTLTSPEGREKIWITPEEFAIARGEFYDRNGELKLRATFGEYRKVDGILFPRRIEVHLPAESTWITLAYDEIQVNLDLEEGLFTFSPPPGADEGKSTDVLPYATTP